MDRKDLKIKALLERINSMEEGHAELRVEITLQAQRAEEAEQNAAALAAELNELRNSVQEETTSESSD